jgi:uncharacterized protein (DUF488 family)
MSAKIIYTIGHPTRSIEDFLSLLNLYNISLLADIRSYPGSVRYPHFNKEFLVRFLAEQHIDYLHIKELGGRRSVNANSRNTAWKSKAFRGYADFMESTEFMLQKAAETKHTAYMCSEAVWQRCHRSLVSDYLKLQGWKVLHILDRNKLEEHPYTQPAKIVQGRLFYNEDEPASTQ